MSDRKRAIETLKQLRLDYEEFYEEHNNEVTQAYDMAISSLETDEAYQLEYESTTKNDLVVDAVSRKAVINQIFYSTDNNGDVVLGSALRERITRLPSVTPQEPQSFKWCTDCKEYDQEKHCCHRYSKVIRDTVAEIEQEPSKGHWFDRGSLSCRCSNCGCKSNKEYAYCPNCGAKMVEPQESEE